MGCLTMKNSCGLLTGDDVTDLVMNVCVWVNQSNSFILLKQIHKIVSCI